VIGLVTGVVLYFTSSFIIQLLNLAPEASSSPRSRAFGGRALRKRFNRLPRIQSRSKTAQKFGDIASESDDESQLSTGGVSAAMKKKVADGYYAAWKDENRREPRKGGLLSTMILEEDDDSSGSDGS
jgi:hypothetical protein